MVVGVARWYMGRAEGTRSCTPRNQRPTNDVIASALSRLGFVTEYENTWKKHLVCSLRTFRQHRLHVQFRDRRRPGNDPTPGAVGLFAWERIQIEALEYPSSRRDLCNGRPLQPLVMWQPESFTDALLMDWAQSIPPVPTRGAHPRTQRRCFPAGIEFVLSLRCC